MYGYLLGWKLFEGLQRDHEKLRLGFCVIEKQRWRFIVTMEFLRRSTLARGRAANLLMLFQLINGKNGHDAQ